jgi:hypothetical protein
MVLTTVSVALVATGGLPDLARASAAQLGRAYTAPVPGPDCDAGGAIWFVARGEPVSTQCERNGLLVTAKPHGNGDVTFQPSDGFASPNYRISVTVTFSSRFDGCVSIFTRSSAAGRYYNNLCGDNSAGILALNVKTQSESQLASGTVQPAHSYTIMTVSDGTSQSLFINGTKIDSVINRELRATINVGLALSNLSGSSESAIFNNFTFTPLPESSHT